MKKSVIILLSSAFLLTSCTTGMGDFKILSTVNMNGLEYTSVDNKGHTHEVKGKACVHYMPFGVGMLGRKDSRIRLAFDRAIKTADKSGTSDEYMLVNASVNQQTFSIPLLYTYDCTVVVGDLAKIKKESDETLEMLEAIPEKTKKDLAQDLTKKLSKKGVNDEITTIVPNQLPNLSIEQTNGTQSSDVQTAEESTQTN